MSPIPRPRKPAPNRPPAALREVVLLKGGHRFLFRCARGQERLLIRWLWEQVAKGDAGLDICDAAVVARQLTLPAPGSVTHSPAGSEPATGPGEASAGA